MINWVEFVGIIFIQDFLFYTHFVFIALSYASLDILSCIYEDNFLSIKFINNLSINNNNNQ